MAIKDQLVVDLTNYKDRVGSRVMPGTYTVAVEDAEMDTSKAGNPMCNLWLRVVGGDYDGATIMDRLTVTDKSLFRVVGFMQAIGLPTPKKRLILNLSQFIGKSLLITVDDGDPYNGVVKSEVRGYQRRDKSAAAAETVDLGDLDNFSEFKPVADEAADDPAEQMLREMENTPETADDDGTVDLDDVVL